MKLDDLFDEIEEPLFESAKLAWARKGNKLVRKYRCMTGKRKGRIVSNPAQCTAAPDIKKRLTLRKTKAKKGPKMARRTKRTKRLNPASRRLKFFNRRK